jgi:hypothetical protein
VAQRDAIFGGEFESPAVEHDIRQYRPTDAAEDLNYGVGHEGCGSNACAGPTAQEPIRCGHYWIEVCARDRSEHQNQYRQTKDRGHRIFEQLQAHIVG